MGNTCGCGDDTRKGEVAKGNIKANNHGIPENTAAGENRHNVVHMKDKQILNKKPADPSEFAGLPPAEKDAMIAELVNILRTQVDHSKVTTNNLQVKKLLARTSGKVNIGFPYEGELINGIPNGKGKIIYGNNWTYEGEMLNGEEHGQGIMKFDNGESYEGTFRHGCFNGYGKYTFRDGEVFEGEWVDDKIQGIGVTKCPSGGYYVSKYNDGLLDGPYFEMSPDGKQFYYETYKMNKIEGSTKTYVLADSNKQPTAVKSAAPTK